MSYPNIKAMLGNPIRGGLPDPILGMDGWAEWDKDGFSLSINYDRNGILKNMNSNNCAISLFSKRNHPPEAVLRAAGNLPSGNSFAIEDIKLGIMHTFGIKPAFDIDDKLYAVEVCP